MALDCALSTGLQDSLFLRADSTASLDIETVWDDMTSYNKSENYSYGDEMDELIDMSIYHSVIRAESLSGLTHKPSIPPPLS